MMTNPAGVADVQPRDKRMLRQTKLTRSLDDSFDSQKTIIVVGINVIENTIVNLVLQFLKLSGWQGVTCEQAE